MKVVALYSIKGGVGKTAATVNLAWLSAHRCRRTLVIDLDPQGASTFYFRIKPRLAGGSKALLRDGAAILDRIKGTDYENLDLLPADPSFRNLDLVLDGMQRRKRGLRRVFAALEPHYDIVLLDCPPSISLLSENVFRAADALLVPVIPTVLSERTLDQLAAFCRDPKLAGLMILPFFSMVDARKRLHQETMAALPERFPEFLAASIPYASEVERMGLLRAPLPSYAPNARAARDFELLWDEVQACLRAQVDSPRRPR